jgi:peptide/nickel transport system substrate-binding protein
VIRKQLVLAVLSATIFLLLSGCLGEPVLPTVNPGPNDTPTPVETSNPTTSPATATPAPPPTRTLSICTAQEPRSLFIYADTSRSAANIREAIYDGLGDIYSSGTGSPILEDIPSLENGGATVDEVEVYPGEVIIDSAGSLVTLANGVTFYPAGCGEPTCIKTYGTSEPAIMSQLVVRFHLLPSVTWSDDFPLTAKDSVFGYQVARSLYPTYRSDLIQRTASYSAVGDWTVEWRAIPGHIDPSYRTNFFPPLPQHAWGHLAPSQLMTEEMSSRLPIGWGPYLIEEWILGDHISLTKNPSYYRYDEDLPRFDHLVFRFVTNSADALAALAAGECDLADSSTRIAPENQQLTQLVREGKLAATLIPGTAST